MTAFSQVAGLSIAVYGLSSAMGWGLASLLLPDWKDLRIYYAPWLGVAQTGFLLILLGLFEIGTRSSCWAALAFSALLFMAARNRERANEEPAEPARPRWKVPAAVIALTVFFMLPVVFKSAAVTSFTIGNNDLYDYIVTAEYLQDSGPRRFLRNFGEQPEWADATLTERVVSWQIPAPRWLSYYYLSFLSSLFRMDPVDLFSLFAGFLLAASIPVIWILGRESLGLSGAALGMGFCLALFNPHKLYILNHTFLPQVCATGFFICFLSLFPSYAASAVTDWKRAALLGILAAGALASYLEVFAFLLFIGTCYPFWLAMTRKVPWTQALKKWTAVFGMVLLLCPYQSYRFMGIIFWHAGMPGGGWPVTQQYYLFLFQLGGFLSHPHLMNPTPVLEWLLDPLLFFLIVRGMLSERHRHFSWIVLLPFVLAGYASYRNDWNYRYYKGFTYAYFYLPLLVGAGLQSLSGWIREKAPLWKPVLARTAWAAVFAVACLSAVKIGEATVISIRTATLVPVGLKALEAANADASIKRVYFQDVSPSNELWAAYFLRDKCPVLPHLNIYLRNDVSALKDSEARHLLARAGAEGKELLRAGPYVLLELGSR